MGPDPQQKKVCPHDGEALVSGLTLGRPNQGRLWVPREREEKIEGIAALRFVHKCPKCGYSEAP